VNDERKEAERMMTEQMTEIEVVSEEEEENEDEERMEADRSQQKVGCITCPDPSSLTPLQETWGHNPNY